VRHARDEDLDAVESLLARVRDLPGLTERSRGTFYRESEGFLHFHADAAGMFADLKVDGAFQRLRVSTKREQHALLAAAKRSLPA
jgi:hypothetical protein